MKTLQTSLDTSILTVTLHRPDVRNAINPAMIAELTELFTAISTDDSVRVVVLRGEGKTFCAGADVHWMKSMKELSREENEADAARLEAMLYTLDTCAKPVVARVHGAALGGGMGMCAVCDIVVAEKDAKFGFTEGRLGIMPAVISLYSVRKVGLSNARAYFLSGEIFTAPKAKDIGLVHEVAEGEAALDAAVTRWTQNILQCAPGALVECKKWLRTLAESPWTEARRETPKIMARLRATPEGQEGFQAFLEKRPPAWAKQ